MIYKTRPCQHCNGTGEEIDQRALGLSLRAKREAKELSLREMAERLEVSAMYLCDLEYGRRNRSTSRIAAYNKILK